MNGYLVWATTTMDDVPVSWHKDRKEAFDAAEALNEISDQLAAVFRIDPDEVERPKVVVFRDGKPVEVIDLEPCAGQHEGSDDES